MFLVDFSAWTYFFFFFSFLFLGNNYGVTGKTSFSLNLSEGNPFSGAFCILSYNMKRLVLTWKNLPGSIEVCPSDDETHSLRSDLLFFQTQLAQKTTLISDSKLKEQEFREQVQV